jgi:hypothetical protein
VVPKFRRLANGIPEINVAPLCPLLPNAGTGQAMRSESEQAYLSRRLEQEEALAAAACHIRVRIIHGELARAYRKRLDALSDLAESPRKAA